jgi:hypothetical protein
MLFALPAAEYLIRFSRIKKSHQFYCWGQKPHSKDVEFLLVNGFPVIDSNEKVTEIVILPERN